MLIKNSKLGWFLCALSISLLMTGCAVTTPPQKDKAATATNVAIPTDKALENTSAATDAPQTRTTKPATPPQLTKKTVTTTAPVPTQQGGIQQISSAQLQTLLNDGITLIDIRRPEEWEKTGIIKGSKLLTFFDAGGAVMPSFFREMADTVPKGKSFALICETGSRTRVASEMMARAGGYGTIYNVEKGMANWIKENREVVEM